MAGIQGPNQLIDLLRALRRRRYQVIVPTLLVATLGIAFAVIVPKRYRVSTRIEISDRTRGVNYARVKKVLDGDPTSWSEYPETRYETERVRFLSDTMISKKLTASPTNKY